MCRCSLGSALGSGMCGGERREADPAEGDVGLRRRTGARTGVRRLPAFHLHLVRRPDVGNHAGRGRGRLGGGGGGRGRGAPWEGRMHAGRVCSAEVWPGCRQARPLCLSLSRSRGRSGRPGGLTRPELSAHRGSCLHEDEAGPGELALREPSESGVCGAVAEVGCRRKPVCPVMCACGRSCVHRFLSR